MQNIEIQYQVRLLHLFITYRLFPMTLYNFLKSNSFTYHIKAAIAYLPRNIKIKGARGVMVIVVENGYNDTSSNPGRDWLLFT